MVVVQVEIFCYALSPSDSSEWRQRIERESEHFLDVSTWSVPDIAGKISADAIHIAVNLNGYTKVCLERPAHLPSHRLAGSKECRTLSYSLGAARRIILAASAACCTCHGASYEVFTSAAPLLTPIATSGLDPGRP